jgi:hypothetical protein
LNSANAAAAEIGKINASNSGDGITEILRLVRHLVAVGSANATSTARPTIDGISTNERSGRPLRAGIIVPKLMPIPNSSKVKYVSLFPIRTNAEAPRNDVVKKNKETIMESVKPNPTEKSTPQNPNIDCMKNDRVRLSAHIGLLMELFFG